MIVYFWGESDQQKLFKIPDLQGLFLRGVSGTSNRDPDANNRTAISYGGAIRNMVGSFQNSGTYLDNLYRSLFDTFCQGTVRADELSFGKAMGVKNKLGDNETRPVNAYVTYIIKASNNPINLKTVYKAKPKKEKKADK
jgi:hypothetical protein